MVVQTVEIAFFIWLGELLNFSSRFTNINELKHKGRILLTMPTTSYAFPELDWKKSYVQSCKL